MKIAASIFLFLVCSTGVCTEKKVTELNACEEAVSGQITDKQLVDWLLNNATYLKKEGCWNVHIKVGTKGMEQAYKEKRLYDRARIELSVASSYLYLGDYNNSRALAEEAGKYAQLHDKWPQQIQSLYLQSAAARAEKHRKAISLAKKALAILDAYEPDNQFLRGKILYNLGAAYSDLPGFDYDKAKGNLQNARTSFKLLGNEYEVVRSALRIARVEFLMGEYTHALATIQAIETHLSTARLKMIYYYQMSMILNKLDKVEQAAKQAGRAKALAEKLKAAGDLKRINALLETINKRLHMKE